MKLILLTFTLFFVIPPSGISEIRRAFQYASNNKSNAEAFYELVQSKEHSEEFVFSAYDGASDVILSKYLDGNLEKLKYFRQGAEKIESAVEGDSYNTEVRFVRLVIQMNTPDFLDYNENIEEDKDFLLEHYSECSSDVRKMISEYASMSDSFSLEEKNQLK
jgi:hypothetical protein